ncbi:hypothetical protein [Longispora albida]|uniref:hypothetical protein n=1 Tax=Longispora albida TaxID=203523 RepID=UPI00035D78A9|nr:hypothetical protein [Longispora albida]
MSVKPARLRANAWFCGIVAGVWAGTLAFWLAVVPDPLSGPVAIVPLLLVLAVVVMLGMTAHYMAQLSRSRPPRR